MIDANGKPAIKWLRVHKSNEEVYRMLSVFRLFVHVYANVRFSIAPKPVRSAMAADIMSCIRCRFLLEQNESVLFQKIHLVVRALDKWHNIWYTHFFLCSMWMDYSCSARFGDPKRRLCSKTHTFEFDWNARSMNTLTDNLELKWMCFCE